MRIGLVAFAGGVALLQVQGQLPDPGLLVGLAALAASVLWTVCRLRPHVRAGA